MIPFENEIQEFLRQQFFESWMDHNDWAIFLQELDLQLNISVQSLSNDLQKGLSQGHSIESQFEMVKDALSKIV